MSSMIRISNFAKPLKKLSGHEVSIFNQIFLLVFDESFTNMINH